MNQWEAYKTVIINGRVIVVIYVDWRSWLDMLTGDVDWYLGIIQGQERGNMLWGRSMITNINNNNNNNINNNDNDNYHYNNSNDADLKSNIRCIATY